MRIRNIAYFFREASRSMSRNRVLSIATISTVAVCVLILGMAVLMTINAGNIMNYLESDIEIIAYLDKELDASQYGEIEDEIKKIPGVKSAAFFSREDALEYLQKSFGEGKYDLKETLKRNPLPDSYQIKALDPHDVPLIAQQAEKISGINKVNYGRGVVENLFSATRWIRLISVAFMALLSLGAIFLISTTIRLAIFARRKEIALMKLVGSTDWFIRWPFFIEGIVMGFAGALIAIAFLAGGYASIIQNAGSLFFLPLVTSGDMLLKMYLLLAGAGAVLGIIGTSISINRYLDV